MAKATYWEPISKAGKVARKIEQQKTVKMKSNSALPCDFCYGPRGVIDMGNGKWACNCCVREMNSDI